MNDSWDLIAPVNRPDVLRAATLLATQLADVDKRRVRLFLDDLTPLTLMSAKIDTTLWLQPVGQYELLRLNLAQAVTPGKNIVRLFGARVPQKYMERAVFGNTEHKLFKLKSLDQSALSGNTAPDTTNLHFITVPQYLDSSTVGIIKERFNSIEIRNKWKSSAGLRQATLASIGFEQNMFSGAKIIYCSGKRTFDWARLTSKLGCVESGSVIFLVENCGRGTQLLESEVCCSLTSKVKLLTLPPTTWKQRDELVWISDYVVTSSEDMAQRAMESGVPLIWLPQSHLAQDANNDFLEWYLQGCDLLIRRCLQDLIQNLENRNSSPNAFIDYLHYLPQAQILAMTVAKRILDAPLMSQRLPFLMPASALREKNYSREYKATIPASLTNVN